jgi:glycosyltransferase involved in cell wall biosynthesis
MHSPTVSICVPTYNGAKFLQPALKSALNQTFEDTEVLIVDDASSDETVAIATKAAAVDSRIRVLLNENNLGLVGNWNRCMLESRGIWVKFLFQDDVLAPTCVEALLTAAKATGCPFSACFREFLFAEGTRDGTRDWYRGHARRVATWHRPPMHDADAFSDLVLRQGPKNYVGEPTVVMFHRSMAYRVGLFDSDLIHMCDAEYWMRLGSEFGLAMVPEVHAYFRVHGESTSSKNASLRWFRKMSVDPIVMMSKMLFAPEFARLRERGKVMSCLDEIEFDFWSRCHRARAYAEEQRDKGDCGPLKEWHQVVGRLPILGRVPWEQALRRKLRAVRKLVRFRE